MTPLLTAMHQVVGGVDVHSFGGDGQASRDSLRSSITPAAIFLYRCVSASPGTPSPVHGARNAAVVLPNPLHAFKAFGFDHVWERYGPATLSNTAGSSKRTAGAAGVKCWRGAATAHRS